MAFNLFCIFHQSLWKPPGVLLCTETLNIHISIILIFKPNQIKWIAPDKTNSNYLCRDGEIYLVWWVTVGETWGWKSDALPLLCLFFFFFFPTTVRLSRPRLSWKRIAGTVYEEFWKWHIHFQQKVTQTLSQWLTTQELQTVVPSSRLLWIKWPKELKWQLCFYWDLMIMSFTCLSYLDTDCGTSGWAEAVLLLTLFTYQKSKPGISIMFLSCESM